MSVPVVPRSPQRLIQDAVEMRQQGASDDDVTKYMAAHGAQPVASQQAPPTDTPATQSIKGQGRIATPASVRGFDFAKDNATRDASGDKITSLGPTGAALSGATFNFAPKIESGIDAGLTSLANKVRGVEGAPSFSEMYQKDVGARQTAEHQYAHDNPKTALAAGLAGGLVPTLATGGAGFGGGIAKTALTSGLYGAGYGAGAASTGAEGMGALKGGVVGAAGGALLGGAGRSALLGGPLVGGALGYAAAPDDHKIAGTALGAVGGLAGGIAKPYAVDKMGDFASKTIVPVLESRAPNSAALIQRLLNATGGRGKANATLIADTKAGGVDPAAAAADLEANAGTLAGQQTIPADVGGRVMQQRVGQLARSGGEAGGKVTRLLTGRSEGAAAGADAELAGALPAAPNGVEVASARQVLDKEQGDLGAQFDVWKKANPGDLRDPAIDAVQDYPAVSALIQRVQRSRLNRGESLPTRDVIPPKPAALAAMPDAQYEAMVVAQGKQEQKLVPDLESLHLMERILYQAKRGAFEGASENPMTRQDAIDAEPVFQLFRNKIAPPGSAADKLFKAYQANRKNAEAIDVGLNLFKDNSAEAVTNAQQAIKAMSPAELQHMQMGAKQALRDNIGSARIPNTDATGNIAAKALPSSGNDQQLLRLAFPDEASYQRALRQSQGWRQQEATKDVAIGNSATAERGAIDAAANPVPSPSFLRHPLQAAARATIGGRQDANAARVRDFLAELQAASGPRASAATFRNAITANADQAKIPGATALAKLTAALLANQSFNRP